MSYNRDPIKVNRILTRKPGIAGVPADVFIFVMVIDLVLYLLLIQLLNLNLQVAITIILVIDGTWITLTLRGVWRFVGLFFKPPRYIRANIPYRPIPLPKNEE
jgi:type IV secretory pathway VirB3-like protein